ncbi:MAG: hypothetical protein JHC85_08260, partial [Chthoniobacterales bacterium]|nr:hypothetical protein [Chthoniobacterales bacterium]
LAACTPENQKEGSRILVFPVDRFGAKPPQGKPIAPAQEDATIHGIHPHPHVLVSTLRRWEKPLVECRDVPAGDPFFVFQTNQPNTLSVFFTQLLGEQKKDSWRLGRGTATSANVTGQSQKDCRVRWSARLARKAEFDVVLR